MDKLKLYTKTCEENKLSLKTYQTLYGRCKAGFQCEDMVLSRDKIWLGGVLVALVTGFIAGQKTRW